MKDFEYLQHIITEEDGSVTARTNILTAVEAFEALEKIINKRKSQITEAKIHFEAGMCALVRALDCIADKEGDHKKVTRTKVFDL